MRGSTYAFLRVPRTGQVPVKYNHRATWTHRSWSFGRLLDVRVQNNVHRWAQTIRPVTVLARFRVQVALVRGTPRWPGLIGLMN